MYRPSLIVWLLLAGAAPGSDCAVATGPDGFCAVVRLEPSRAELATGGTLRIRITGLDCTRGTDCVNCGHRRLRWLSSAPNVAAVDSTGLVRGKLPGVADIRMMAEEPAPEILASMRVVVAGRS